MAKALREGGLYYVGGVAVDAGGVAVEDAPKLGKDTDPKEQPGALGAPTPEEKMGRAIAQAIVDPKGTLERKNAAVKAEGPGKSTEPDDALPPIKDLADHVSGLKTVEEVQALAKRDDRKSAEKIYDARIAELESK